MCYKKLKQEIGLEYYLHVQCVKRIPSKSFVSFGKLKVHMGCLRSWVGLLRGVAQECPYCLACKEPVGYVLFEYKSYDSRDKFLGLQVFETSSYSVHIMVALSYSVYILYTLW